MKKSVLFLSILLLLIVIQPELISATIGQWSTNGTSMYYNDGNVGLGTLTPSTKLDITGEIQSKQTTNGGSTFVVIPSNGTSQKFGMTNVISDGLYFGRTAGSGSGVFRDLFISSTGGTAAQAPINGGSTLVVIPNNGTSQKYGMSVLNNAGLYFGRTSGIGAGINTDIYIGTNGNVGIGTTTTDSKLNVNGTIKTKELIVTNSGWADYVFDNNYQLMSLSNLENFIAENKHLPDIPSAVQVETAGISVADMQIRQMAKIEELTLYTIQQDKKINELETRLDKLESGMPSN
ncbi:MAG: hypothetical protein ABI721_03745 [Candidatus Dojkabacteria bacterium]